MESTSPSTVTSKPSVKKSKTTSRKSQQPSTETSKPSEMSTISESPPKDNDKVPAASPAEPKTLEDDTGVTMNTSQIPAKIEFLDPNDLRPSEIKKLRTVIQKRILCKTTKIVCSFFGVFMFFMIVVFVVMPLCFFYFSPVRRTLLFGAWLERAVNKGGKIGVLCARNVYLQTEKTIRIGAWYVPNQANLKKGACPKVDFDSSGYVFLKLHGIYTNRQGSSRMRIVKLLATRLQADVLSIDYRGFGDSSKVLPSLDGSVHDAAEAFQMLHDTFPKKRILIWAHSLGTAIGMYAAAELFNRTIEPAGIILESAVDSLSNVIQNNGMFRAYKWFPCFKTVFSDTVKKDITTAFDSISRVPLISTEVPMLMLHAEQDFTVPLKHGLNLYKKINNSRLGVDDAAPVEFRMFKKELGYGHSGIGLDPGLPAYIRKFLDNVEKYHDELDTI